MLQQQKGQAVQLVYVYPLPLRKRVPARKHDLVLVALIVTLSAGLSLGVNILVAGCIGRGRTQDVPAAAGTAVLLAAVLGCALLVAAVGALLILLPTGPQYMAATSVGLFFTGLLSGIHIGCTIVGVFVLFYGLFLFLRGRS